EKGRTKWDKKNGKKEDQYEFELDGEYCTRIKGHNSGGEKIDIGHAVCWAEDIIEVSLDEREKNGGQNRGNFLMKVFLFNRWAKGDKTLTSFILSSEDSQDPDALKKAHETMGFEIDAEGEKVSSTLHGGIDAGILTEEGAVRIKGLNKYIWRVWSQRKLDRYFRMTKDLDLDALLEAGEAFTESQKGIAIETLRKTQPEEVVKFIEGYLKENKQLQKTEKLQDKKNSVTLEEVTQEVLKDMDITGREETLRRFYERYMKITKQRGIHERGKKPGFDAGTIADMFYLDEACGFNIFDLLEKRRTKWEKKRGKKEDRYEFKLEGEYNIHMEGYDARGEKIDIGEAVCLSDELIGVSMDGRAQNGGQNRGNFLMKVFMLNRWAKGDKTLSSLIGENADPKDLNALKKAHETMGFEIDAEGKKVSSTLHGGINAGILIEEEAKRIKGLNKYIWRVWSQRKLDRYFRMTKNLDKDALLEANEVFTESCRGSVKETLRNLQPEEVVGFIEKYLNKDIREQRDIEKTIRKTGNIFTEAVSQIGLYQGSHKTVPVDIVIDLSLFPATDEMGLEGDIETWAQLILLCRDLRNVNFVFEKGSRLTSGRKMTKTLEEEKASAPEEAEVIAKIKEIIRDNAIFFDTNSAKIEKILDERINPRVKVKNTDRIEIPIVSASLLEWIREKKNEGEKIGLAKNQYPVAMEGAASGVDKQPILRNFEAALVLGLMKAALVMIPSDEDTGERDRMEKNMSIKIKKLYEILKPGSEIEEETVRNMISPDLVRRLNRAIEFALPPIMRTNIEELRDMREGLNLALKAA
ncbi:MAG: hypothetical protein ABH862_03895, partial [Candidatus Omnitrophota bacterium]